MNNGKQASNNLIIVSMLFSKSLSSASSAIVQVPVSAPPSTKGSCPKVWI